MDIEDGDHDEHLEEEDRQEEPEEGGHDVVQQGHANALLETLQRIPRMRIHLN